MDSGIGTGMGMDSGGSPTRARILLARLLAAFDADARHVSVAQDRQQPGVAPENNLDSAQVAVGYLALDTWFETQAQDAEVGSLADLLAAAHLPQPAPLVTFHTALARRRAAVWSLREVRVEQRGFLLLEPDRDDIGQVALLAAWAPWSDDAALGAALEDAWREHMERIFFGQQTHPDGRLSAGMLERALRTALDAHPAYWSAARDYAFPLDTPEQRDVILRHLLHATRP